MDIKLVGFICCYPLFSSSSRPPAFTSQTFYCLESAKLNLHNTDNTHLYEQQPNKQQPQLSIAAPTTKAMRWYTTDYCTICCRHIPLYSWYYHSYTCHRRTTITRSSSRPPRRSHSRRRETEREYEYERETTIRRTERSRSRHRSSGSSYYYYLPWRYHHRPAPAPEPVRCPTPAPLPEPPCRRRESEDKDKGWRRRTVDIYIEH